MKNIKTEKIMKKEIPDFLIEMSKRMNTQDNPMTADPMFEVRHKDYLITEEGYNEHHFEIVNDDGDCLFRPDRDSDLEILADWLHENETNWCAVFCEDNDQVFEDLSLEEFSSFLTENYNFDFDELPETLRKLHMQEIEVTVNTHFTEADAQAFIDRKQHDYPPLYIYAISLAFCWNMIELRNWIKGLSHEEH